MRVQTPNSVATIDELRSNSHVLPMNKAQTMSNFDGPLSANFVSQRLRLRYVTWGDPDAPPIVLQHGGRDHGRSFDWTASALAKDWFVICPDLRGHGDSAWSPDADYTMLSYLADFAQLIDMTGAQQVTICAHSLGGNIATRYAGLFPHRVRRLANIEGLGFSLRSPHPRSTLPYADNIRQWLADRHAASARSPRRYARIEDAYERMHGENSHLSVEQARHLTLHGVARNEDGTYSWKFDPWLNIWPVLDMPEAEVKVLWETITCPVLLFYGAESWASNPAEDGRLAHFQNARVKTYEKAGHWLHHDQFDRFITDLKAFIT